MALRVEHKETAEDSIIIIRSYDGAVPRLVNDKDTVAVITIYRSNPGYAGIHIRPRATAAEISYIIDALSTARIELANLEAR